MDSPIEAGEHQLHVFDAEGVRTEVVVWGDVEPDWDEVKRDFTAIAEVTHDVFDHDIHIDRYVYIVHAYPGGRGGTEHLNSTVVQTRPETFSDHDRWIGFMGLVTHEYFHTWNVKRFRPVGITPYDYDKENYTTLLWLVEGTTSYYDELLLVRAGIVDADWYIDRTASTIGSVMNRAGRHRSSLSQSSYDAWLKFWGQPSPDHSNTTVNFYSHGSMASMCLDLMIRDATDNARSLDDVMRVLNERYDWRENGYTPGDVRAIAAEVAGTDMAEFFDRYIDGTEPPPFAEALAIAGLELTQDDADGPPTLGASINGAGEVTRLRDGSPAFAAGINVGDEVVSIAGRSVAGRDTGDVLAEFEPGDAVTVGLFRYRAYREIELELGEPAPGRYRLERVAEPTERQRRIYEGWLGESWPFETTD
ncbi:MAG: PDZ domain-containing protein [Planctomycetota bacterium]